MEIPCNLDEVTVEAMSLQQRVCHAQILENPKVKTYNKHSIYHLSLLKSTKLKTRTPTLLYTAAKPPTINIAQTTLTIQQ